jgi:predicted transposase YbfD/YdcC
LLDIITIALCAVIYGAESWMEMETWGRAKTDWLRTFLALSGDARTLGEAIRRHWAVENRLHWVLDMAFDEDHCRVRVGHAAESLSILRRYALNLPRREATAAFGSKPSASRPAGIPPISPVPSAHKMQLPWMCCRSARRGSCIRVRSASSSQNGVSMAGPRQRLFGSALKRSAAGSS